MMACLNLYFIALLCKKHNSYDVSELRIMMQEKLSTDLKLLEKQMFWLEISYKQCSEIGIKKEYSIDEFEFENQGTLVDVVNNAHKRNLFQDIEHLRLMKDMRNTIVHEYIEDHLVDVFADVLEYTKSLMDIMENTQKYMRNLQNA